MTKSALSEANHRATLGGSVLELAVGWNVANIEATTEDFEVDYGFVPLAVGIFITVTLVACTVPEIPTGRIADRFGARRTGFLVAVIVLIANGIAMVDNKAPLVLSMRAFVGIGATFGFIAESDYVREQDGPPFAQALYGGVALGVGMLPWRSSRKPRTERGGERRF